MSLTAFRPVNTWLVSTWWNQPSRHGSFSLTSICWGETSSRWWLVGGIAKQRHARTESIFDSNHLWASLCCSEPMEWNIATIYRLAAWVPAILAPGFSYFQFSGELLCSMCVTGKLMILSMLGNTRTSCGVHHINICFSLNMVSMLGNSRTGCSVDHLCFKSNMASILGTNRTGCGVHHIWSMLSSTWTRYNVTVAWRTRTLLPHPTPDVACRRRKDKKKRAKLPGYWLARPRKQPFLGHPLIPEVKEKDSLQLRLSEAAAQLSQSRSGHALLEVQAAEAKAQPSQRRGNHGGYGDWMERKFDFLGR